VQHLTVNEAKDEIVGVAQEFDAAKEYEGLFNNGTTSKQE
jgi:hypothetical protein